MRYSEISKEGLCCSEYCLFDYLKDQGKNPVSCCKCHITKKEVNDARWGKSKDFSGYNFCSQKCLTEVWNNWKKTGVGPDKPEPTPDSEQTKRYQAQLELQELADFDLLTPAEKKDFMEKIRNVPVDKLDGVLTQAKQLIQRRKTEDDSDERENRRREQEQLQTKIEEAIQEIEGKLNEEPKIPEKDENWRILIKTSTTLSEVEETKQEILEKIKFIRREQRRRRDERDQRNRSLDDIQESTIFIIKQELKRNKISPDELNQDWIAKINLAQSEEAVSNIKTKILSQIAEIKNKKAKEAEKELLQELVQKAKTGENWNSYENLEVILAEIKDLRSSGGYSEVKSEVEEIEGRLKELNPTEYQNTNRDSLNQQKDNEGLSDNNTNEETKQAINNALNNPTAENKNKAEEAIAQNGAENKLEEFLNEVEKEIENGVDEAKKGGLMLKIIAITNQNQYMKNAAQKLQDRIESLKSKLSLGENEEQRKPTQKPSGLPSGVVALIVVSVVGVVALTGVLLLRRRKLKRRKW